MTAVEDFRRDAVSMIAYKQLLDWRGLEGDEPTPDDEVHLLRDFTDENRWTGYFVAENNAERVYEVSYPYAAKKFYITEYYMRECVAIDPNDILYSR